jgi:alanine dehydrogenase
MNIGVPKERWLEENRVGLTPSGARALVETGNKVYVETLAGAGCGFSDRDYESTGAKIAYSPEEPFKRGDLVVKVAPVTDEEVGYLREGQAILAVHHLVVSSKKVLSRLADAKTTTISAEFITDKDGSLPVVKPTSEIAGRMSPQVAAHYLEAPEGGRGILLSGLPGVPPAEVVIIGGGVVGRSAAWTFLGAGAHVTILEMNTRMLESLDELFRGRVATMLSTPPNISKAVSYADVVVASVLNKYEEVVPMVVIREMVRSMKPRSVILDISIDMGGCVETSRPTSLTDPVYVEEGVTHYCVPNMPSAVARSAAHAWTNVIYQFVYEIAEKGIDAAAREDGVFATGLTTYKGRVVKEGLARNLGLDYKPLKEMLGR